MEISINRSINEEISLKERFELMRQMSRKQNKKFDELLEKVENRLTLQIKTWNK